MLNEFPIFDYEDIQLIPNKCVIKSRAEADTSVTLGNHTFKLPVVPANMQTILDENVAEQLAKGGYFYIMHRFDEAGRIPFIKRMHEQGLIASISVGVRTTSMISLASSRLMLQNTSRLTLPTVMRIA